MMTSDDRELRDALEKAQAALQTTRAELQRAREDQARVDRAEEELETMRRQLAETQDRERALRQALATQDSTPPTELEVDSAPSHSMAEPIFGGAAADDQSRESGEVQLDPEKRRVVQAFAGTLFIGGAIVAFMAEAGFVGLSLLCVGLLIATITLSSSR